MDTIELFIPHAMASTFKGVVVYFSAVMEILHQQFYKEQLHQKNFSLLSNGRSETE